MISFFPKRSTSIRLDKSLLPFISNEYDKEEREIFQKLVLKAQKLRTEILSQLTDGNTTIISRDPQMTIDLYREYYMIIHNLSQNLKPDRSMGETKEESKLRKIGMDLIDSKRSKLRIGFNWGDSFQDSKFIQTNDFEVEKNCMLFNLAVFYARIALKQDRQSEEGLKVATQSYIQSAKIFDILSYRSINVQVDNKTMDMSHNALKMMCLCMKAQAQTCFFEKAQIKKFSHEIICKLAIAAAEIYQKTAAIVENDPVLKKWIKKCEYPFHKHCSAQKELFYASAYFWKSKEEFRLKNYGKEVAYLKLARAHIQGLDKKKLKGVHQNIVKMKDSIGNQIDIQLRRAEDDNTSIYHHIVPQESQLEKIKGTDLANILPKFNIEELEKILPEIEQIVPANIKGISQKLKSLIRSDLYNIQTAQEQLNEKWAEYLTPINRQAQDEANQSLLYAIQNIVRCGGSKFAKEKLNEVQNKHNEARLKHEKIRAALKKEEAEYNANAAKYAEMWKVTPSSRLNESFFKEADVIKDYLEKAETTNNQMEKTWKNLENVITFMESKREDEILESLPSSQDEAASSISMDLADKTKLLMNLIEEKKNFIRAEINKNEQSLYKEELKHFKGTYDDAQLIAQIREETMRQIVATCKDLDTRINAAIQSQREQKAEYDLKMKSNGELSGKRALFEKFEKASKGFEDLKNGFNVAMLFYEDLNKFYLDVLDAKVQDFLNARNEEQKRLSAQIEEEMRFMNKGYFGDDINVDTLSQDFEKMGISSQQGQQAYFEKNTLYQPPPQYAQNMAMQNPPQYNATHSQYASNNDPRQMTAQQAPRVQPSHTSNRKYQTPWQQEAIYNTTPALNQNPYSQYQTTQAVGSSRGGQVDQQYPGSRAMPYQDSSQPSHPYAEQIGPQMNMATPPLRGNQAGATPQAFVRQPSQQGRNNGPLMNQYAGQYPPQDYNPYGSYQAANGYSSGREY